MNRKWWNYYKK